MKENNFLKNPGDKKGLLSSKFFQIPGKWVHGIMARRFEWQNHFWLHSHEHYELEYLAEGEMSTVIDGQEFSMKPGDFYLLGTTSYHSFKIHSPKAVLLSIYIYHPASNSVIKDFLETAACPVIGTIPEGDRPAFESAVKQIYETENFSLLGNIDTVSLSALLALHIAYRANPTTLNGEKNGEGYLQKALHYILANYNEQLTLEAVAGQVGLSPSYFSRIFSAEMGVSFLEYITRTRVRKAQNMLVYEPQKSITDIAFEVGYGSYSNFYRAFLNTVGCPPREYRDRNVWTPLRGDEKSAN